jgi:hypothetical protein
MQSEFEVQVFDEFRVAQLTEELLLTVVTVGAAAQVFPSHMHLPVLEQFALVYSVHSFVLSKSMQDVPEI